MSFQLGENNRKMQLINLSNAITNLIDFINNDGHYLNHVEELQSYLYLIDSLLENSFNQDILNNLSRSIKPIINTFRDWTPPLFIDSSGQIKVPKWFEDFEKLHDSMMKLAFELRVIGYI